jgi:hypothetical protein
VEVNFVASAAVEISDLQCEGGRAQDDILEGTQSKVIDFAVHGHDVLVTVLIDGLANHVASIVFWVRLHPGGSEGLMQSVSMFVKHQHGTRENSP